MKRLTVSLVIAFVVSVAAYPALASDAVQHPPRCSWASNVGDFCLTWDPVARTYTGLPPGVPADGELGAAIRDHGLSTPELLTLLAALFVGVAIGAWLILDWRARRRPRDVQVAEGSSP